MPPKAPMECDLEPYLQYHNRLASFLDWKLEWELNQDKPSPERLARAGFFSFTKSPYHLDNVGCPYCGLALDSWEPEDDPVREHKLRSPACLFVRGRQTVRDMGNGNGNHTATTMPSGATDKQNGTNNAARPKRACKERADAASKANGLALAGANGEQAGPPQKRRPGRPRKQPGSG
ncbi:hypothetical protein F5883DRAFT_639060 [Diaporthe sp. PMI_573]|nr:hypothetical protein F5883DRAFT_639060 [Diaporthaceae sp. PMI_573]